MTGWADVSNIAPLACWPWSLRDLADDAPRGRQCRYCARDIAAPVSADQRIVACLYCALDRGIIPAIELPLAGEP